MNVIRNPYHPVGMIVRGGRRGQYRFAVVDAATGREISYGCDWQAAYENWLGMRRVRVPVPSPLTLAWVVSEFGECHRQSDESKRKGHERDTRLIAAVLMRMGNPLASALQEVDCEAFRNACLTVPGIGTVRMETLIRRIRQAWIWASKQGWLEDECLLKAKLRDPAIRHGIIEMVVVHLPDDALTAIRSARHEAGTTMRGDVSGLSREVSRAAQRAAELARSNGRLDLIDWLGRCKLSWFLDTAIDESLLRTKPSRTVVAGRIEHVNQLRNGSRCKNDTAKLGPRG